jgi:2-aminoethylphosphonate-pyruvate transaminase
VAVHHETTTGRLNDLHRLGRVCKELGVPLLLDAVISFGGEELCFQNWNLAAAASCANKCLHGAPGLPFLLVRKAALQSERGATCFYLDLWRHYLEQERGASPFTQAVHVAHALCEALREMEEAGFVVYADQGSFFGEVFRIAVMGEVTLNDIDELLDTCRAVLHASAVARPLDVPYS